jgi:hypothetical protein
MSEVPSSTVIVASRVMTPYIRYIPNCLEEYAVSIIVYSNHEI